MEKVYGRSTEFQEYNYRDFASSDFLPFRTHLPVGSSAPDCHASLLEQGSQLG